MAPEVFVSPLAIRSHSCHLRWVNFSTVGRMTNLPFGFSPSGDDDSEGKPGQGQGPAGFELNQVGSMLSQLGEMRSQGGASGASPGASLLPAIESGRDCFKIFFSNCALKSGFGGSMRDR